MVVSDKEQRQPWSAAQYYKENRERIRAESQQYYAENRERICEQRRRRYAENKEYIRELRQGHSKDREKEAARDKLYKEKYPEKSRAKNLLNRATRSGKITKQPCAICGNTNTEAHHHDYSKPLDVTWFCRQHHSKHHQKERMSQDG